jgi:hypothetical protein
VHSVFHTPFRPERTVGTTDRSSRDRLGGGVDDAKGSGKQSVGDLKDAAGDLKDDAENATR